MVALVVIVAWLLAMAVALAFTLASAALFMRGFRKAIGRRD